MNTHMQGKQYNLKLNDGRNYIIQVTPLRGEDGERGLHPSNNGYVEVSMIAPKGESHPFAVGAKPQYLTVKRGLDINPKHAWFIHAIIQEMTELPPKEVLDELADSIINRGY